METYCKMDKLTQECVECVSLSDIMQREHMTCDGVRKHVKNRSLLPGRYYYRLYPTRERFAPNTHNRPVEIIFPSGEVRRFESVRKLADIEQVSSTAIYEAIKQGHRVKGNYRVRYWDGVE